MPPMLFDRYLVLSADDACDLATGAVVRIASLADQPVRRPAAVASLADVLDHGRDGAPRALTVTIPIGSGWNAAADRVAGDAVARGYIPIAVSLYTRVSALIGDELRERTLLLLAAEGDAPASSRAFLDAASRSPRPHVLLTLRIG